MTGVSSDVVSEGNAKQTLMASAVLTNRSCSFNKSKLQYIAVKLMSAGCFQLGMKIVINKNLENTVWQSF
jgi:hypothetical protein